MITWSVAAKMRISGERALAKDGTPMHVVLVKAPHGAYVDVGLAFRRTVGRGEYSGLPMFNLVFHEEGDFSFKLPVTAWPRGQGKWEMTLDKPRQEEEEAQAAAPADAA